MGHVKDQKNWSGVLVRNGNVRKWTTRTSPLPKPPHFPTERCAGCAGHHPVTWLHLMDPVARLLLLLLRQPGHPVCAREGRLKVLLVLEDGG